MSNFMAMVYAVLADKGVDTKGMDPQDAIDKYNELTGKTERFNTETGEKEFAYETKEEKTENNSKKALTNTNSNAILPSSIKVKGFKPNNLEEHCRLHGDQFGLNNKPKEYNKRAMDFMTSHRGELYSAIIEGKEKIYRFDEKTAEFGAVGKDGNLITYFLPKNGNKIAAKNYVDRYLERVGAKKL